jgi:hypothetical protein
MELYNYFNIKKNQINNSSSSSLIIKKRKFDKYIYKNPFSNNFLPNIVKSNYLSIKNNIPLNKKLFFSNNPNLNNIIANSIYQLNSNLLSLKKPNTILINKVKSINNRESDFTKTINKTKSKKLKNNESRNKGKDANYRRAYSLLGNENSKQFIKTLNLKKNFRSIENAEDNNTLKEDNAFPKTRSMFMTGMYFLGKTKKNQKKFENNENEENNEKEKKINYEFLSFRELIKQIEQNKKKIIDNQNDIEDMIQTAKETHKEIWKCNRFKQ